MYEGIKYVFLSCSYGGKQNNEVSDQTGLFDSLLERCGDSSGRQKSSHLSCISNRGGDAVVVQIMGAVPKTHVITQNQLQWLWQASF